MAVSETVVANAVAPRLDHLLRQSRNVKQSTSVDPPLQVSELVAENEGLLGIFEGAKEMRMLAVESAAKSVFYANLGSTEITEPAFVTVWNLLDILQFCGDRDLCSPQLVLLLIEELLDSQSISGCRTVFNFLESRREAIIAINSKNKDLVILRLCNELLRRLSRAEDPVFCGRVYIFMFQSFPLGDKSSVNLRGNFHTENTTTFEAFLRDSNEQDDAMQLDQDKTAFLDPQSTIQEGNMARSDQEGPKKEERSTLDVEGLYPVFWSLQQSFSNPPALFEQDNFKHFQKSLEATLSKFKDAPKVIQASDFERKNAKRSYEDDHGEAFANTFNPKYLTSRDLFKLELSDVAFQRHILVQALILIDFLLTLTEKSKNKPFYQNAQKAMQYQFTLGNEETEWALGIKNAIANYLQEGPDGKFYYRMVDTVLSRDKNWVRWKMENCQPFTRDRVSTTDFLQAKSGAQRAVASKKASKTMGASHAFEFLYNTEAEKGLSRLRHRERVNVADAESYAKKVQTADLDVDMASTEEERRQLGDKISSYTWRGLRLASRKQLSVFDKMEHGRGLEALQPPAVTAEMANEDGVVPGADEKIPRVQDKLEGAEEPRVEQ